MLRQRPPITNQIVDAAVAGFFSCVPVVVTEALGIDLCDLQGRLTASMCAASAAHPLAAVEQGDVRMRTASLDLATRVVSRGVLEVVVHLDLVLASV